jgi:phosphoserine phosphatase
VKLFILDIDNTVTKGASIWEVIHHNVGTWERGKQYLEQFSKGEIDFKQFAAYDINCWQGQKVADIEKIYQKVEIRNGFYEFLDYLKSKGIRIAIISSSIKQFIEYLDKNNQFDYIIANSMEIKDNKLTGGVRLDICCFEKGCYFEKMLYEMKVRAEECGGIGDSPYDLPYLEKIKYPFIMGDKLKNQEMINVQDFKELKSYLEGVL